MAIDSYIFFLPPNTPDTRDHTVAYDNEVAVLEGEHWQTLQNIAAAQARIEQIETELNQRQPAIKDAAREAAIRREVEEEAAAKAAQDALDADQKRLVDEAAAAGS